jgi:hypothetical protein
MAKSPKAAPARKSGGSRKSNEVREAAPATQSKRSKLKEIAGVKVPKDLREVAAAAQKLAENPLVRDIVTAGVMAAMAALAEAQQENKERQGLRSGDQEGQQAAKNRSTAKVVAAAAAGAISKRLISEAKTRGPELLAKLEGFAEGSGSKSGGSTQQASSQQNDDGAGQGSTGGNDVAEKDDQPLAGANI